MYLNSRDIYPASLAPALKTFLSKLNAPGTVSEIPRERFILHNMLEEKFPLYLECIVIRFLVRNFRPTFKEVNWLWNIRIPYWLWRIAVMLDIALPQPGDG